MKLLLLTLAPISLNFVTVLTLECYSCQTGYQAATPCSNELLEGMSEQCNATNSECIQAVEWFQDGALKLVRRVCYTPPRNSKGGFCQNYPYKGELRSCKSCKIDLCNNDIIYEPLVTCQATRSV